MRRGLARWLAILPMLAPAAVQPGPDVQAIMRKSIAATQRDWIAFPEYRFHEQDGQGNGSRTYAVTMVLGSPYRRLIAINGHALSGAAQRRQERLMKQAMAKRQAESSAQRASRTAQYEKERRRDHAMMMEIAKAFDFSSMGETTVDSHQVFVLKATPKAGYQPPSLETRALTGMEGTLWIDTQSYQWVKVEARVIHPVAIVGFLAKVMPGTHFELEKTPVADGLWFPSHFSEQARARVLAFAVHRQTNQTFSDYVKAESGSGTN